MKKRPALTMTAVLLAMMFLSIGGGCPAATAETIEDILAQADKQYKRFEKQVRDITIVQQVSMASPEGEALMNMVMMKKGPMVRIESRMTPPVHLPPGVEPDPDLAKEIVTVTISDGKNAWLLRPGAPTVSLGPDQAGKLPGKRFWWENIVEGGRVAGSETVDGRDCWLIEMAPDSKSAFKKLWLDKNTLVQVQAEMIGPRGQVAEVTYMNFKKIVPGYEIPYRTVTKADGQVVSTVQVEAVQLNTGLADSLFDPEKGLKP